jgi:spore germination protein YaaH
VYGYRWYTGTPTKGPELGSEEKPNPTAVSIGTPDALQLAEAYGGKIQWDAQDHSAYFYFYRDQMREWIFFTDVRTFRDRYDLVQKDGLQGFCSWVLGQEDPGIWAFLPKKR